MTPEEKLAEEIRAKMGPEDIERLQSCTDEEAQKMLEEASIEIPIEMLDDVAGGGLGDFLTSLWKGVKGIVIKIVKS